MWEVGETIYEKDSHQEVIYEEATLWVEDDGMEGVNLLKHLNVFN